jgi:hypothetical protein
VRTKDFGKQGHAQLREENTRKTERENDRLERFPKVGRDARAEGIRQRGEEEVEGAGKLYQFMISDFGFTIISRRRFKK